MNLSSSDIVVRASIAYYRKKWLQNDYRSNLQSILSIIQHQDDHNNSHILYYSISVMYQEC